MSDVLKKYSIVIGADTKELMTELNKAEKELTKKLDNKDLGAGVRESIEKLVKEIGTMRSELKTATKDINNSITAISTDSLKNEFGGMQKIISSDIQSLQTKIEGLQGSIDILNNTDFSKLETGIGKTLSGVQEKMDKIMEEFKTFHDFTQDLRVGSIDTSNINKSIKENESTLKTSTKKQKDYMSNLIESYTYMSDAITNALSGKKDVELSQYVEWLGVLRNISREYDKMDSISIQQIFGDTLNIDVIRKQMKDVDAIVDDGFEKTRKKLSGRSADIYLRWKTEINPDETAQDIIDKIDKEYTDKVQKHLDEKPLKFKTEVDSKDLEDAVKKAIIKENNLLKAEDAHKIKVGLEIDGLDKSKLENISEDLSKKVNEFKSGDVNVSGGNLNISSNNLAQETTLGEIRDILSNWNGSGIPGTQSKEQIQQNHQTQSNLKNAGYLLRGKFRGRISKDESDFAKLREQLLSEQEWLYARMQEMKKLRRIGVKRITNNPNLLKESDLYNASVEVDGVEYAKWGKGAITLADWQAQLDKVLEDGINDYFKDAVKSIEKQIKSKKENLNLLGVEFDKDGKILARNTVAIGENEVYKAAYGKASSLKNQTLNGVINEDGIVENSLQEEKDKLELLKLQRTTMQQIVELANRQSSTELSKEEEEKLNSLKEQLRTITQICSDEVKFNALLKEESELQDKMNSNKLDSKGFDRLISIRQEMSTMWTDISDDMIEFSKQSLSSTDTQLSQIDNDIAQQQLKVNKIISNYRKGMAQIQRETFGDEIRDEDDYERRLKEWKNQSSELAVLQNSITKVDEKGKVSYDMSALTETEKERYWYLNKSVPAIGEQLNLYRKLNNLQSDITGETKKENEVIVSKNKNLSDVKKIISSIYNKGGHDLTESENLSLMSIEELQDLSNKLGSVVDSASVDINDKLEQKAYQYIDERIKFLENQLSHANDKIKQLTERGGNTSYWEGQKSKIESDLSALKATQNQARTEKEIIEDIKTQNNLDDESLAKIREVLDLTVKIEKSNQRISQLKDTIDKESVGKDLEITKRKANQELIIETDNLKSLYLQRENIFNNLSLNDNSITPILSDLLQNGLDGIPASLITEFVNKVLSNSLINNTVNNVKSTEATRQSEAQMAASIKERIDAVIKERLEQQKITEEKRKQAELNEMAVKKKESRSVTTKNREVNKKYNSNISELESSIYEQSKVLDEAKVNLDKAINAQERANKNLKKYESFNDYQTQILYYETLKKSKQEELDKANKDIQNTKNRIDNLTKTLKDRSFSNGQTEDSVKNALDNAKNVLEVQENNLLKLQENNTKNIESYNKIISDINAKRSKSRTKYNKGNIDTDSSFEKLNSLIKSYGLDSFNIKEYVDEVLKYMTSGGDYSKLPQNTSKIFSEYINKTKESSSEIVSEAQSIYNSAKQSLEQSKTALHDLNKSKEAEKKSIQLYEAEKKYVEVLEDQFKIANTSKSKRTEKSDLFSYTNKNSVSKGMSDKQKMASFKVDYQLDTITKLAIEQEKVKTSAGETSDEYKEISNNIDVAKTRLETFRNEAVELGLTISQVTGRAILDSSKESTVLYKGAETLVGGHYTRTSEQKNQFKAENKDRAEEEKQVLEEQKELQNKITEAKLGTAKAEGTIASEQKKTIDNSKYYKGMTEGEAELAKKLFDENGKLFEMKKKNSDYTEEDISNQKKIVEQLQRQVEQSERLELYRSKKNVSNARLRSEYKDSNIPTSPSVSSSPDLPATEKTLVEIKNILNDKLGLSKTTDKVSTKQSSEKKDGNFNFKGYQEVAKSLNLLNKNGGVTGKANRQKVYDEMDRLGIARYIEEDTNATKKNIEAKKDSKKAVDSDTSATKKNVSEKTKQAKKSESDADKFNAELYKKIAEENGWLTQKGTVQKDKRDYTYLEMEKQQPGSSGKTKKQLEELRKKIEETKVAQKELNKEKQKDASNVTKKETKEVKKQSEAVKENTKAKKQNNAEKSKGKTKSVETNISSGNELEIINSEELIILNDVIEKEKKVIETTKEMYRAFSSKNGIVSNGISWFGDDLDTVYSYSEARNKDRIARLTADISNFLTIDANGSQWNKILYDGIERTTDELAEMAKQAGYAGLAISNVYDSFAGSKDISPSNVFAIFDDNILKNATDSTEIIKLESSIKSINSQILEITNNLETEKVSQKELNALLDDYNNGRHIDADDKSYIEDGTLQAALNSSIKNIEIYEKKLDSLKNKQNELQSQLKKLSPIEDVFQGDLSKYSKDTIQKFIDGAKSETPEMEKAFEELSKIPEEQIRKFLEIHSPSEVTKRLGYDTIEGFIIGIKENSNNIKKVIDDAFSKGTITLDEKNVLNQLVSTTEQSFKAISDLRSKALKESGIEDMFFVDGKQMNQNDVAKYIKNNTVEVQDALNKYINVLKEEGFDDTVEDAFDNIFGSKHKTVSNAYASAIKKITNVVDNNSSVDVDKNIEKTFKDYESKIEKLNKVSLSIDNGAITNKNLQERAKLTVEVAELESKINSYVEQGVSIEQAGFDIKEKMLELSKKQEVYEKNLLTTKLSGIDASFAELQNSPAQNQAFIQQVNQLSIALARLHELSDQPFLSTEEANEAKSLFTSIKNTINELNSLNGKEITSFVDQESVKQFLESMQGIRKETIRTYDSGAKISGVIKEANGVSKTLEYTWNNVLGCFVKSNAVMTNHVSLWTSLKGQVEKSWGYLKSYFSGYMVAQKVFSELRQGYTYIKELDAALTEMKKVSNETTESLKNFQNQSFETAKSIGTTAVEIQNSVADFMRLGYSLQEASQLAKDANIYANVGDMEINEATEHMISSIQAWQSEFSSVTEASTAIIDKYNEIGNNYAITSADIGSAMERSAAALKVAGNTLDESIGLITAGNLIQQDADTTANALKVMSLRIRGSKTELEDMGEEVDNLASSSSKLREELIALTGVDIMYDDNTYKSTAKIIKEIGESWDKLSNVSQANVLEKLAGKTRASTVAGLIENYKTIEEVVNDASKAQGSALKENQEYIDSIAGKTAQLTTQIQEFWHTLIDSETVKNGITLLTDLLSLATKFVDTFGVLGTATAIGGGILGAQNIGRPKMFGLYKYADINMCSLGY